MTAERRRAIAALTTAGLAWGTTVPLSKLALGWLSPGWLTVARFGLAAAILILAAPRTRIRTACTPTLLASGAVGYGASVVLQNAGIARTSVSYAALLVGASPVLVAVIAAAWHRTVARPAAWAGFVTSLAGVALLTSGPARGASAAGDGLVLASLLLSAAFTVAQTRLLSGRDPIAVTAMQFLGAALAVLPFTVVTEGLPTVPHNLGPVLATAALAVGGTMLPFTMFAYGQSRVSAEVAGAFLNLEPLIGAAVGIIAFGDPLGLAQLAGGAAIITGITMSTLPLLVGSSNSASPGLGGAGRVRRRDRELAAVTEPRWPGRSFSSSSHQAPGRHGSGSAGQGGGCHRREQGHRPGHREAVSRQGRARRRRLTDHRQPRRARPRHCGRPGPCRGGEARPRRHTDQPCITWVSACAPARQVSV